MTLTRNAPASAKTELVNANNIDLFARSIGTGPDLVVLHGGPSASHISLLPAFDRLAQSRRLRYYDQRGCGRSRVKPDVPLDWRCHVDDLRELLDYWQIERATIVGHSWGALLALLFAIRNPTRMDRMVLVTPASVTAEGRSQFLERLAQRMSDLGIKSRQRDLLRSNLRKNDPAAFRKRVFDLTLAPHLKNPNQSFDIPPFHITHRVREAVWRSLGNYDFSEEISTLSVPALVVHGRFDPIPLSSSQQIALLLGAHLEIFEDSGHMPFFEEQDRFVEIVGAFLAGGEKPEKHGSRARAEDQYPMKTVQQRVGPILRSLKKLYPEAGCSLRHADPLELLVATILSAQCTDKRVNEVTKTLFSEYKSAKDYAEADPGVFEDQIRSTGFFRNKTKSIISMAAVLVDRHEGNVPKSMDELVELPGVGRKTANVVLGNAYGIDVGVVVDTHVKRISNRLQLTASQDPEKIEQDLMAIVPKKEWTLLPHLLIHHGRAVCVARKPKCEVCALVGLCPGSIKGASA